MSHRFAELSFTPSVLAAQQEMGTDEQGRRLLANGPENRRFGAREQAFLETRDSFFLASVSESGWPYVQHRGGPPGFLRVLSDTEIAFADFHGNRQYLSLGNTKADDRVALIALDYPERLRLKLLGRIRWLAPADEPELTAALAPPPEWPHPSHIERIAIVTLEAFAWNCSKHITPRYTAAEIGDREAMLRERIRQLDTELAALRGEREHTARSAT
jgi:predicted pyridoxine 5'-phosphate oxidase superfamily flavin-nucleotide-binding protein